MWTSADWDFWFKDFTSYGKFPADQLDFPCAVHQEGQMQWLVEASQNQARSVQTAINIVGCGEWGYLGPWKLSYDNNL